MEEESFSRCCWPFLTRLWRLLDERRISLGTADGCLKWWMDLSYCSGNQIFTLNISVGLRTRMSTFIYISASTSCSHQYSLFAGVRVSATSLKSCRGFILLWFRFLLRQKVPAFQVPLYFFCSVVFSSGDALRAVIAKWRAVLNSADVLQALSCCLQFSCPRCLPSLPEPLPAVSRLQDILSVMHSLLWWPSSW